MNRSSLLAGAVAIGLVVAVGGTRVEGYESYHDPDLQDAGYCATCHSGFGDGPGDDLHDLHVAGDDPMTANCNLCHTGSGFDNPLVMWSIQDLGSGLGCTGCHGDDYGEVIDDDYRGFPTQDRFKWSGYGLRKHHVNSGITLCNGCHPDVDQSFIFAESTPIDYYARTDVSLGGAPMDPCTNEDTANDGDVIGLDNDGDLLYDDVDDDCATGGPELTITGACPGVITVLFTGGTPGGTAALARSTMPGNAVIPGGPCAGTPVDLDSPSLLTQITLDGSGAFTVDRSVAVNFCGTLVQGVDLTTCQTSSVAAVP